ncbi:Shy11-oxygenase [Halteromyces radiatus]|uniref:Shy11-oxygenase n=1 Tax=Halteromyces radiatus TaxID=101107 RepID=UPI00221EF09C|nr:Shy11-oxygenase [Halteromyces radiatus]KAI8099641.1 Shy11-oxygenase [Halteromyces radiatus]
MVSVEKPSSIPILDFELYQPDDPDKTAITTDFLKQLYDTMHDIGFFYIRGHGVPLSLIEAALETSAAFFDLPLQDKLKVDMGNSPHYRGFTQLNGETTDYKQDNRETFDIGREYPEGPLDAPAYTHLRGPNQWPTQIPSFKPIILQLLEAMHKVGLRVLRAMAQSLDINEKEFMDMFGDDLGMRMKLVYYPGMDNEKDVPLDHGIGVGPHKDYGFLALLLQDKVGGLQVQLLNGQWVDATPIEGTFVVNIGEIFEKLTKKRFIATTHRVLNNKNQNRYSIPLFLAPHNRCQIPDLDRFFPHERLTHKSDVKEDQLLQGDIYGENEFKGYRRSHVQVTHKWYYFDEEQQQWRRRPVPLSS